MHKLNEPETHTPGTRLTRVISGMPAGIISELNESMWRQIWGVR